MRSLVSLLVASLVGACAPGAPSGTLRLPTAKHTLEPPEAASLGQCRRARASVRQVPKRDVSAHYTILKPGRALLEDGVREVGVDGVRGVGVSPRALRVDPGGRLVELPLPSASEICQYHIGQDGQLTSHAYDMLRCDVEVLSGQHLVRFHETHPIALERCASDAWRRVEEFDIQDVVSWEAGLIGVGDYAGRVIATRLDRPGSPFVVVHGARAGVALPRWPVLPAGLRLARFASHASGAAVAIGKDATGKPYLIRWATLGGLGTVDQLDGVEWYEYYPAPVYAPEGAAHLALRSKQHGGPEVWRWDGLRWSVVGRWRAPGVVGSDVAAARDGSLWVVLRASKEADTLSRRLAGVWRKLPGEAGWSKVVAQDHDACGELEPRGVVPLSADEIVVQGHRAAEDWMSSVTGNCDGNTFAASHWFAIQAVGPEWPCDAPDSTIPTIQITPDHEERERMRQESED